MKECDFCGSKFAERKCYFCEKRCCTSCMTDDKSRCKQCYIQKRKLGWKVIKKNKTAILLLPEISLTPQIAGRFKSVFPGKVVLWHSRLT